MRVAIFKWLIWGNNAFTLNFVSNLGNLHLKRTKKKRSVTVPWREYRFLSGFLYSDVGKMVEDGEVRVVSLLIAQMKTWRKLRKSPTKTDEVPFRTSLAGCLLYGTCQRISLLRTCCKFPRCVCDLLADEQKQQRAPFCPKLLNEVKNDPYVLSRVIAGDETWDCCNDTETRRQSS